MDTLQKAYYEKAFLAEFLERKGNTFQDFFSTIMEKAHPGDFQRIRPWGKKGDFKNDGYLKSKKTLFQVYAPNEMKSKEAVDKIEEDFNGALPYWKEYFSCWVFVHNSRQGLGPEVEKKLLEIESENRQINIENWGFEELRKKLFALSDDDLSSLLGPVPSYSDIRKIGFEEIKVILETISHEKPLDEGKVKPVPKDKISSNKLSSDVETLLKAGMRKSHLVEKFFNEWHDPTYGDRIAKSFKEKYTQLKGQSLLPDEIFYMLQEFAIGDKRKEPKHEAAALAVLAHLFEQCDIFERKRRETS